ncbi:HalOD1 output domain-containing protein [Halorussus sp. AFM4]|uniref:HalOD1 output domain-containing protein n=1 Tax=Halorussus sp. AFM4 TaxID=3421651 RepID=UPI003EBDF39D
MAGTTGESAERAYRIGPSERPSEAVLAAVRAATGRDVGSAPTGDEGLEPLYRAVDPDALDALFEPTAEGVQRDGRVTFSYAGCTVTVSSDGVVEVRPHHVNEVGGD